MPEFVTDNAQWNFGTASYPLELRYCFSHYFQDGVSPHSLRDWKFNLALRLCGHSDHANTPEGHASAVEAHKQHITDLQAAHGYHSSTLESLQHQVNSTQNPDHLLARLLADLDVIKPQ